MRTHLLRAAAAVALLAAAAPAAPRWLGAQGAQAAPAAAAAPIPLPEHPRPDFLRADWVNLNGRWQFAFDKAGQGERAGWHRDAAAMPAAHRILVPFSWGSPASGVPDSADVAWYARPVTVPAAWRGRRVFLVVGASDWRTSAWLDGDKLGDHQGGYTPFAMELTRAARPGAGQRLVLRVDDTDHPFKLEGKQGYGKARGPWQTVYLEARGAAPLEWVHFTPDVARGRVTVEARLLEPAPRPLTLALAFRDTAVRAVRQPVARGAQTVRFDVPVPNARLWQPEDPYLYEVTATLGAPGLAEDRVETYFGMRTVGVATLPGTSVPYIALNGKPVYMQLALDQAYHPQGWYTFPTDSVLRDEILRARKIGLTGLREHIKVEAPRKLYWADRLGVLIMADVPNWWGPPDSAAFREHEVAMRGMIARDFNHPSVFSWIAFNETWGLRTKGADGKETYLPATQAKVAAVQQLAKRLDPTRLVEDNSVCCGAGHTTTDLNTWHEYLAGWQWPAHMRRVADSTFPGSTWNFERGYRQAGQPMLNSEFGNVWGYEGSTGDVDYSWDYHQAVDVFRRTPKMAGWLYTEHHDVVNEWNGYWRFDRSDKETGVGDLAPGMTLRDFHAPYYVAVGEPGALSRAARAGERVEVPLWASFLTGDARAPGDSLTLRAELYGWNAVGERATYATAARRVPYRPWMSEALAPLPVTMPAGPAVAVLAVRLEDAAGTVLHRNFTTFVVGGAAPAEVALADGRRARVATVPASAFRDARWSLKQWQVLGGRKVNGAGSGHVEYRVPWPAGLRPGDVAGATFLVEASAKRLLGKDRDTTAGPGGDYMRGGGLQDPGKNPNAYPMTGTTKYPSAVTVRANGELAARVELADDPADSRGILSWHAQPKGDPKQRRLAEAGSYGELVRVALPPAALAKAAAAGEVVVRLEVDSALPGGLAVYGREFGRYPLDPTVLFVLRDGAAGRSASAPGR
jgi:hypothetical protein